MKGPSPLLGFNNNVKHKGRVFHIQTEDSGVNHPHIITHLFADGGRILKTKKTSYAEHVGDEAMSRTVRTMMQDQHKAMFIALRGGHFDHLLESLERPSPRDTLPDTGPATEGEAPASIAAGLPPPPPPPPREAAAPASGVPKSTVTPSRAAALTEPALAASASPAAPSGPRPASSPPAQSPPKAPPRSVPPPPVPPPPSARAPSPPPPAAARPPSARPPAESPPAPRARQASIPEGDLELDLDALERAAQEMQTPVFQDIHDLPPPPAAVLGASRRPGAGTTSYRSVTPPSQTTMPAQSPPVPPHERVTPRQPASDKPRPPERRTPVGGDGRGGEPGRYAPSRPASIFGSSRPAEGASIFGEELISEKSLDEVILSYLAEDLEGPPPKK